MKKLLQVFTLLLFTGFILMTCRGSSTTPEENGGGSQEKKPTFTITTTVTPSDAGSVSPSGENTYEEGEGVEIQADANDVYLFTHWSGDVDSTSINPISITVDQDYSLKANFELKSYKLAIKKEGKGTVKEEVLEEKSKEYEHGTVVELTATPLVGYRFVEWKGDVTGKKNPAQVVVDDPKVVTAVFEKKTYTLTVNKEGEGAVKEEVVQEKSKDYEHGAVVKLTANSAEGWKFSKWEGANTSSKNPIEITVDNPKEVTAVFERKSFSVSTTVEGEGSVSKTPNQETYKYNSEIELEATSSEGYQFVEWQGDITGMDNPIQVVVDSPKEVTAVFEKKTYTLTVNKEGEGTVSEEVVEQKSKDYEYGTAVELTGRPAEGWEFVEWKGAITSSNNPVQVTVDDPKKVTAVFEKKSYPLTVTAGEGGTVAQSPDKQNMSITQPWSLPPLPQKAMSLKDGREILPLLIILFKSPLTSPKR